MADSETKITSIKGSRLFPAFAITDRDEATTTTSSSFGHRPTADDVFKDHISVGNKEFGQGSFKGEEGETHSRYKCWFTSLFSILIGSLQAFSSLSIVIRP